LSSANACSVMPNVEARSARSVVYKMNNSGPKTEPCGTEHVTSMADEVFPPEKLSTIASRCDNC